MVLLSKITDPVILLIAFIHHSSIFEGITPLLFP